MGDDEVVVDGIIIREPTHDEFVEMVALAVRHEYENYHKHVPAAEIFEMATNFPEELWDRHCAAYCDIYCSAICVMVENMDGSQYMYCLFVKDGHRNDGLGSALTKHALKCSHYKVSLHVNSDNLGAQRLYKRLGFKPYGMQMPEREIFMSTKKGLGGRENW